LLLERDFSPGLKPFLKYPSLEMTMEKGTGKRSSNIIFKQPAFVKKFFRRDAGQKFSKKLWTFTR